MVPKFFGNEGLIYIRFFLSLSRPNINTPSPRFRRSYMVLALLEVMEWNKPLKIMQIHSKSVNVADQLCAFYIQDLSKASTELGN